MCKEIKINNKKIELLLASCMYNSLMNMVICFTLFTKSNIHLAKQGVPVPFVNHAHLFNQVIQKDSFFSSHEQGGVKGLVQTDVQVFFCCPARF